MKRPLCAIALIFAAAVWLLLSVFPKEEYSYASDRTNITLIGTVTGKERRINSYTGDLQSVVQLRPAGTDYYVLLYMDPSSEPEIGRTVKVSGEYRAFTKATNPGEFDSQSYYRILKTAYRVNDARILGVGGKTDVLHEEVFRIKIAMEEVLDKCLQPEDAGIMKAVLLGDKGYLDEDIKDIYKRNGIIHIIAISGLHISIIGLSLYRLLRKTGIGVIPCAVISMVIMYLYGIMCGMSTSATRAIIMFDIRIFADIIGRTYDMLTALSVSAMLILLEQPLYIFHSGFLMSFGAVIAIGYVLPALPDVLREGRLKIFGAGISITLVTIPVHLSFYYTFPVYSIILNLFILPLLTVLLFAGIISIFAGFVLLPAGMISSWVIHFVLAWFRVCCSAGDILPGGTWYAGHSERWQIFIYLISLILFILLGEDGLRGAVRKTDKKSPFNVSYALRGSILLFGIMVLLIRIKPDLKITMVDVGQGDGIVVQAGHTSFMIDGGSTTKQNLAKYQLVPFMSYEGIGSLDAVILTHEDEDHMSGILEMMDMMEDRRSSIRIRNLILPDIDDRSKGDNFRELEARSKRLKIPITYIGQGDEIGMSKLMGNNLSAVMGINSSKELRIKCIGPVSKMITDEPNAYSTILLVKLHGFSGLFTGDVESLGQSNLNDYIRKHPQEFSNLTLLKVAHHGSKYTTDEEFLKLTNPRISLISCGVNNRYNHPHDELLQRLEYVGTGIYRTDKSGAVTLTLKGDRLNIETFF